MTLEILTSEIAKEDLPIPTGYRILIEPIKVEEKTKGGIIMTDSAVKAKEYLRYVGRVLAKGPLCYSAEKFAGLVPLDHADPVHWCEVGDWVAFQQHAGQDVRIRTKSGDTKLKLVNDDDILAVIPEPEAILIYV